MMDGKILSDFSENRLNTLWVRPCGQTSSHATALKVKSKLRIHNIPREGKPLLTKNNAFTAYQTLAINANPPEAYGTIHASC